MTIVERGLLGAASILIAIAGVGWFWSPPARVLATRVALSSVVGSSGAPLDPIDTAARVAAETDPFRLNRRPASVRYRPELEGVVPPPKPPNPTLVLAGLVGRTALLDGVPGRSATAIVRARDTLGGLLIQRVGHDTVLVSSADTTWRLTLRHTWQ